jgi:hypothetical protein
MKKVVVFSLLFLFILQSTKNLWIITSFHINREYIADNLCVNRFDKIPTCKGQCFLDDQLENENKESKKQTTQFDKETVFVCPIQFHLNIDSKKKFIKNSNFTFYESIKLSSYLKTIENPPELV